MIISVEDEVIGALTLMVNIRTGSRHRSIFKPRSSTSKFAVDFEFLHDYAHTRLWRLQFLFLGKFSRETNSDVCEKKRKRKKNEFETSKGKALLSTGKWHREEARVFSRWRGWARARGPVDFQKIKAVQCSADLRFLTPPESLNIFSRAAFQWVYTRGYELWSGHGRPGQVHCQRLHVVMRVWPHELSFIYLVILNYEFF